MTTHNTAARTFGGANASFLVAGKYSLISASLYPNAESVGGNGHVDVAPDTDRHFAGVSLPDLGAPEDIALYELHVRDFSAGDPSVPEPLRGTFKAFTTDSNGTRHLPSLAQVGLTHVHLLPAFDLATIGEERSAWKGPGDLGGFPPDSEEQQAAVTRIAGQDGLGAREALDLPADFRRRVAHVLFGHAERAGDLPIVIDRHIIEVLPDDRGEERRGDTDRLGL